MLNTSLFNVTQKNNGTRQVCGSGFVIHTRAKGNTTLGITGLGAIKESVRDPQSLHYRAEFLDRSSSAIRFLVGNMYFNIALVALEKEENVPNPLPLSQTLPARGIPLLCATPHEQAERSYTSNVTTQIDKQRYDNIWLDSGLKSSYLGGPFLHEGNALGMVGYYSHKQLDFPLAGGPGAKLILQLLDRWSQGITYPFDLLPLPFSPEIGHILGQIVGREA